MEKYAKGLAVASIAAFLAWFFRPEILDALPLGLSEAIKALLTAFSGWEQLWLIVTTFVAVWTLLALIFIWAVPSSVVVVKASLIAGVAWFGLQKAMPEAAALAISGLVWVAVLLAAFNGETKRQNQRPWDIPTPDTLRWGRIVAAVVFFGAIIWLADRFQASLPIFLVILVIFLAATFLGRNYFTKPGQGYPVNERKKNKK